MESSSSALPPKERAPWLWQGRGTGSGKALVGAWKLWCAASIGMKRDSQETELEQDRPRADVGGTGILMGGSWWINCSGSCLQEQVATQGGWRTTGSCVSLGNCFSLLSQGWPPHGLRRDPDPGGISREVSEGSAQQCCWGQAGRVEQDLGSDPKGKEVILDEHGLTKTLSAT